MVRILFLFFIANMSFAQTDSIPVIQEVEVIKFMMNAPKYIDYVDENAILTYDKIYNCMDHTGSVSVWTIDSIVVRMEFTGSSESVSQDDYMIYFKNGKPFCLFYQSHFFDPGCGDPDRELQDETYPYPEKPNYYYFKGYYLPQLQAIYSKNGLKSAKTEIQDLMNWVDFSKSTKKYVDFFGTDECWYDLYNSK